LKRHQNGNTHLSLQRKFDFSQPEVWLFGPLRVFALPEFQG